MGFVEFLMVLAAVFVGVVYAQSRKLRNGLGYVMRKERISSLGSPSGDSPGRLIGR